MKKFLTLCFVLLGTVSFAAITDISEFRRVGIMENGRIMPMDSYAEHYLLKISGRKRAYRPIEGEAKPTKVSASQWMAELFFTPSETVDDLVFIINNPEVLEALNLEPVKRRRYSFKTLQEGLQTLEQLAEKASAVEGDERNMFEKDILQAYQNVGSYLTLVNLFEFGRPHPDFAVGNAEVKKLLNLPEDKLMFSYLDMLSSPKVFAQRIPAIAQKEPASWTSEENELFRLSSGLFSWSKRFKAVDVSMVPMMAHGQDEWVSPWDAIAAGVRDAELVNAIKSLSQASAAFLIGEQARFDEALRSYNEFVLSRSGNSRELKNIDREISYNKAKYFFYAKSLYILAFVLGLFAVLFGGKGLRYTALALLLCAMGLHLTGMGWRMYITDRPPITNLYGTFVFVGVICALLGLIAEYFTKNALGTMAGAFTGFIMLAMAGRFALEGDTMGKVVAVLNSNFWLSTHVITINMGYAGVFLAGVIGHVYLIQVLLGAKRKKLLGTFEPMLGFLSFGLTFSFIGTMLGGIWADQSWGRFWGWDPKENGALLIVIWVAIIYHARMANMIREVGTAVGAVLGCVVVMIAWLGTNLLGVGLHSYGFTSGLARGLLIYIIAEFVFCGLLWLAIRFKQAASN